MITFKINEDKVFWLALGVSLLFHALIFIFSGKSFIPQAQFSLQPSMQMVEISFQEMKPVQIQPRKIISTDEDSREVFHAAVLKPTVTSPKTFAEPRKANDGVITKADPGYYQNSAPAYPPLAKQMHEEGLVLLSVDVNNQGMPVHVQIIQSSGHRMLDEAAFRAVGRWKFQPGHIGNIPIGSKVTVPIRFKLEV